MAMNSEGEPVLPYDPERSCPKCDHRGDVARFSTSDRYQRGVHGELLSTQRMGDPLRPHLVIACVGCGWEWLSETKDAGSDPIQET